MPKRTPPPIRLDQEVSRVLLRLATLAVLALVVAVIANVWRTQLYAKSDAYITANEALGLAHSGMLDEETALRGYLDTRQTSFLDPYTAGQQEISDGDTALQQFVANDRILLDQFVAVRLAQNNWITGWSNAALSSQAPARLDVFLEQGKELFDSYRVEESRLGASILDHLEESQASATTVAVDGLVAEGLVLVLAVVFWWRSRRRLRNKVVGPVSKILADLERLEEGDYGVYQALGEGPAELRSVSQRIAAVAGILGTARAGMRQRETESAEHAERLRRIVDMGREIAGSLNLHYVLQAVSDSVLRVGAFARCVLWLTDEASATLLPAHDSAGIKGRVEGLGPIGVGEQTVGKAARFGRVVGPQDVSHPEAPQPWSRAIAIPMIVGARVIGVIEIGMDGLEKVPLAVMELIETLSSQAATAIEAARLYEQAEMLGKTDALTLLPNRRDLDRALGDEVSRAQRYGRPLAVAMVDIDHFKAVNDTEGHARGDEILQETAAVMRGMLRTVDTIYRYGGEEFLIVMPETDGPAAFELCNRLRAAVGERVAVRAGRMVTLSCGVASFPSGGNDPARLIATADQALYSAKRGGRNRVVAAADPPAPVLLPAPLPIPA